MNAARSAPLFPALRRRGLAALAGAASLALLCGCQMLSYESSQTKLRRLSLWTRTGINSLTISASTNGILSLSLDGYQHDQTEGLAKAVEGAVRGLKP